MGYQRRVSLLLHTVACCRKFWIPLLDLIGPVAMFSMQHALWEGAMTAPASCHMGIWARESTLFLPKARSAMSQHLLLDEVPSMYPW